MTTIRSLYRMKIRIFQVVTFVKNQSVGGGRPIMRDCNKMTILECESRFNQVIVQSAIRRELD